MRAKKSGEFRSSVYENRPAYADFDAPAKNEYRKRRSEEERSKGQTKLGGIGENDNN